MESPAKRKRKKKQPKGWQQSNAKVELYAVLMQGDVVPLDPPDNEGDKEFSWYFSSLPQVFAEGNYEKFPRHLNDLRDQIEGDISRAKRRIRRHSNSISRSTQNQLSRPRVTIRSGKVRRHRSC